MNIKRLIACFLVMALLGSGISVFAAAESIIIDGKIAEIPADMGTITEKDDRTFVPIRFVMEYLGCYVDYDDSNHAATISSANGAYIIQEDNPVLYIVPFSSAESSALTMDTVPYINLEESRMYIPIRFLAEAIGYTVGWDEATQTVTLIAKK